GVASAGGAGSAGGAVGTGVPTSGGAGQPGEARYNGGTTGPAGHGGWLLGYGGPAVTGWSLGSTGIGDSGAVGGMTAPAAPAATGAASGAATRVAEPALPAAAKTQPLHSGNPLHPATTTQPGTPARPDGPAHRVHQRDKPLLLVPLNLRGLRRKLKSRLEIHDEGALRKDSRDEEVNRPWGREELLHALGLRPPEHEQLIASSRCQTP
ncbi:hypothetical protein B1T50_04180, partial [Mycobacterium kansasii]